MKRKRFPYARWRIVALCACALLFASGGPGLPAQNQSSVPDIVRFLEQATFGPTLRLIEYVKGVGIRAYLQEQFEAPMSDYPELPIVNNNANDYCGPVGTPGRAECVRDNYSMYPLQVHFYRNALYGPDQLRQRVAFALGQILVVSGLEIGNHPSWMRPYQQLLYAGAFGNFRDLLYNVTLNPAMGNYLDMVNSVKANAATGARPNENYAREVLQLFSIGLYELNQDGTPRTNDAGLIPAYTDADVETFARAFTGWTFAPQFGPGITNYIDPMRVRTPAANYHDRGEKRLLNGKVLPPGQSTLQDLNDTIDNIFNHPNVGPFIGKQLIQHLVTSNPSPAYVARVAAAFNGEGNNADHNSGLRGDLRRTIRAILLDPEARSDDQTGSNHGRLRDPVLYMSSLLRAFNATSDGVLNNVAIGNYQIGSAQMGQNLFNSPSVFNFYPPGGEFRLYSTANAVRRINFARRVFFLGIPAGGPVADFRPSGTSLDLTPFAHGADNTDWLINRLNTLMMHGSMSQSMREIITDALANVPETQRVQTAAYLIATSSQYQVEQ